MTGTQAGRGSPTGPEFESVWESMAIVTPAPVTPLEPATTVALCDDEPGSKATMTLGRRGHWAHRVRFVGDNPFNRFVMRPLRDVEVMAEGAEVLGSSRTGGCFDVPQAERPTKKYCHPVGSATTSLDPTVFEEAQVQNARVVHLSSIGAAFPDPGMVKLERPVTTQTLPRPLVNFDANDREGWRRAPAEPAPLPSRIAGECDLEFVGMDGVRCLRGCVAPEDVRDVLRTPEVVAVKDDGEGDYAPYSSGTRSVPSPPASVVASTGPGEAFAARHTSGLIRNETERMRLHLGHLVAAHALGVEGNSVPIPSQACLPLVIAASEDMWSRFRPDGPHEMVA